jgi:hypothetical protein
MRRDSALYMRGVDAPNSPLIASEKMDKSQLPEIYETAGQEILSEL